MKKYLTYFSTLFSLCLIFNSCTPDDMAVNFTNPHDTKSDNYIPADPAALSISGISENYINLSWKDNSLGESGFIIERSDSVNNNFKTIDTAASNIISYNDNFLVKAGITYYYRLRAFRSDNKSFYTNTASKKLDFPAPSDLKLNSQPNDQNIILSWKDNSSLEKKFIIQSRIPAESDVFQTIGITAADITNFTVKNLDKNKYYEFRVYAEAEHNTTSFSNITNALYGFLTDEIQSFYSSYNSKSVQFSPVNNNLIASGDEYYQTKIVLYNTEMHTEIAQIDKYGPNVKYSPRGDIFAIAASGIGYRGDSTITIVDAKDGKILQNISFKGTSLDFNYDGSRLIACSYGDFYHSDFLAMIDMTTYRVIWKIDGLHLNLIRFTPDGKRIIASQQNFNSDKIFVLNASDGSVIKVIDPDGFTINALEVSYDGSTMAAAVQDKSNLVGLGTVQIWDLNSFTMRARVNIVAQSLAFMHDSKFLAAGNSNITMIRVSDGFIFGNLRSPNLPPVYLEETISFNHDDTYIAGIGSYTLDVHKIKRQWRSKEEVFL